METISPTRYFLCLEVGDYPVSLEARKVYRSLEDPVAEGRGFRRIVDESGEDYLYPASLFVPIEVPREAEQAF